MSRLVPTRIDVPRPLPPLTYLAPEGLPPGLRVKVRLGRGASTGVVLGPDPAPPEGVVLRPVEALVDPWPLLPPKLRELLDFAGRYYGCGLAHLLPLCLPAAIQGDWESLLPDGRRLAELREAGAWGELASLGEAWHGGRLELPTFLHRRTLRGAGLTEVRRTGLPHPPKVTAPQGRLLAALEAAGGAMLEDELLQKTRDDAAGEAFDKTARMLNLGYPGGPLVDACAQEAATSAPPFSPPKFRDGKASWSFSGLKTAVKLRIAAEPGLELAGPEDARVRALCRTLNETVAAWLLKPVPALAEEWGARALVVSGGVACNSALRRQAEALAARLHLRLAIPEPRLCTDNGAMIAAAGALLPPSADPWSLNADADLKLPCPEAP